MTAQTTRDYMQTVRLRAPALRREANARLIAAAPDLLAALRDFVDYFGPDVDNGLDEILTNARAAIARATA